jgi:hypothetical protein
MDIDRAERSYFGVAVAVGLLAAGYMCGRGDGGRYAVVPEPGNTRAAILLDTQTGQSWKVCGDKLDGWCEMTRTPR